MEHHSGDDDLTRACFTTACTGSDNFRTYTYDPVGNRLTEGAVAGTTTYSYNAADELTQTAGPAGTTTYTYDADGNELTGAGSTYTYNLAGEMTSSTVSRMTTSYWYDGDGNRIQASTGKNASQATQYVWDPTTPGVPQLAAELDGSSAAVRSYTYGLGQVAMAAGGKAYYYAHDGLGSVVNVTSSAGATEWTYDYLPYGGFRASTQNDRKAPANVLGFAGQLLDPTGLYYMRARQYDPATGRFTAVDPKAPPISKPCTATYAYAKDNPISRVDPTGAESQPAENCWQAQVAGAVGLVALAPIDALIGIANIVVAPSVLGELALLPADAAAVYATGYLATVVNLNQGGSVPCDQIELKNPANPFGG